MPIIFGAQPSYNGQLLTAGTTSNVVTVTVDFGHPSDKKFDTTARVTVPATWVTALSPITVIPSGFATVDHSEEEALLEEISAYATNRVAGVSFDVIAYAPEGTWGRYTFHAFG